MADITVITLTKDEERNIERCIASVKGFAKRHIVVDSGSMDSTCEIARRLGAEVHVHAFENYARQFNWALDNLSIDTKWVLRLDADECFSKGLCGKLEKILADEESGDVNGILMEANFYFMDRHIRHGGPKKRKTMIFRNGFGRVEDRQMDEHTIVSGGRILELDDRFEHFDFKDLDSWISKMNWYATREMMDYFAAMEGANQTGPTEKANMKVRRKKFGFYYRLPMFLRCMMLFIYNYIFRLGFLDGKEGFIYHWMYQRWFRTLVDAKIYEQMKFKRHLKDSIGPLGSTRDVE